MSVEARRGCGYRKVGGIYLVSSGIGLPCDRMPFPLTVCPTCSAGIKQARGWTWVDLAALTGGPHEPCVDYPGCVMCAGKDDSHKAGLLWIGERFYKTPADFAQEAHDLGISRRISTVPKDLKIGETWVLLAHPKAVPHWSMLPGTAPGVLTNQTVREIVTVETGRDPLEGRPEPTPGIFRAFKPERIEVLVTESQSKDEGDYMAKLAKRGLTPVIVPDNDKDHQGTVYDAEEENGDTVLSEDSPLAELVQ